MTFFRLIKASILLFLSPNSNNNSNSNSNSNHPNDDSNHPPDKRPLNVALIGAGILATGSHAPILQQFPSHFNCVAVWSRNLPNANNLATKLGSAAMATTDLDQILWHSPDIDAVILTTPIDVQSGMVLQALQAGKHVLSERPVAINMEIATELVEEYEAAYEYNDKDKNMNQVWSVAGNFRYEPAIRVARKALKEEIGKPFLVSLKVRAPFLKSTPFSEAMWRNNPSWYGGMIVEAFCHASAMLRQLFDKPISVSAQTSSQTTHIPCMDTMTAQVTWANDVQGTISLTYASTQHAFELEVIGSEGRMVLSRKPETENSGGGGGGGYRLLVENGERRYHQDIPFGNLESEMLAFSESILYANDAIPRYQTPRDALHDLELVDACLESGKLGGSKILLTPMPGAATGSTTTTMNVDHLNQDEAEEIKGNPDYYYDQQTREYTPRGGHGNRRSRNTSSSGTTSTTSTNWGTKWHGKEQQQQQ